MENVKKYDLDRVTRLVITVATIALAIFLIQFLSPVLMPFLIGFVLAYMINPAVQFLQKVTHIKNRGVVVVITLLLIIAVLTVVFWFLIPYFIDELTSMTKMLTAYAKSSFKIPYLPASVHDFIRRNIDVNNLVNLLSKEQWENLAKQVANGTWSVVGETMSIILSIVSSLIVLLYMFFVLLDFEKLSRSFKAAIPKQYRHMSLRVLDDVQNTMSRYFRGQALVSMFVGIIFAIEFYIIGLPIAIIFGLSIGLLNMVPYLQLISIPFAAFLCLVTSVASGGSFWVLFAWTIGAYCLCQVIQDLVLIPAIMKSQMGLNPAIIFLALSLWAYVLGFIGLIIALPLTTLIISYYCEFVLHQPNPLRKRKRKR